MYRKQIKYDSGNDENFVRNKLDPILKTASQQKFQQMAKEPSKRRSISIKKYGKPKIITDTQQTTPTVSPIETSLSPSLISNHPPRRSPRKHHSTAAHDSKRRSENSLISPQPCGTDLKGRIKTNLFKSNQIELQTEFQNPNTKHKTAKTIEERPKPVKGKNLRNNKRRQIKIDRPTEREDVEISSGTDDGAQEVVISNLNVRNQDVPFLMNNDQNTSTPMNQNLEIDYEPQQPFPSITSPSPNKTHRITRSRTKNPDLSIDLTQERDEAPTTVQKVIDSSVDGPSEIGRTLNKRQLLTNTVKRKKKVSISEPESNSQDSQSSSKLRRDSKMGKITESDTGEQVTSNSSRYQKISSESETITEKRKLRSQGLSHGTQINSKKLRNRRKHQQNFKTKTTASKLSHQLTMEFSAQSSQTSQESEYLPSNKNQVVDNNNNSFKTHSKRNAALKAGQKFYGNKLANRQFEAGLKNLNPRGGNIHGLRSKTRKVRHNFDKFESQVSPIKLNYQPDQRMTRRTSKALSINSNSPISLCLENSHLYQNYGHNRYPRLTTKDKKDRLVIFPRPNLANKMISSKIYNCSNNHRNVIYGKDVANLRMNEFSNDVIISTFISFILGVLYFDLKSEILAKVCGKNNDQEGSKDSSVEELTKNFNNMSQDDLNGSSPKLKFNISWNHKIPKNDESLKLKDGRETFLDIKTQFDLDEVYCASSYFWTHEVKDDQPIYFILKNNLHEKNLILFPICEHSHWYLIAIRNMKNWLNYIKNQKLLSDHLDLLRDALSNSTGSVKSEFYQFRDEANATQQLEICQMNSLKSRGRYTQGLGRQLEKKALKIIWAIAEYYFTHIIDEDGQDLQLDENQIDETILELQSRSEIPVPNEKEEKDQVLHKNKCPFSKEELQKYTMHFHTHKVPQQQNGWKCGYYVCQFIETILTCHNKNKKFTSLSFDETNHFDYLDRVYFVFKVIEKLHLMNKEEVKKIYEDMDQADERNQVGEGDSDEICVISD